MNVYISLGTMFPFGFEGGMWDMIVLNPDHCLFFTLKTASIKSQISSKTSSGETNITKRHHQRHHQQQPGELRCPIQIVTDKSRKENPQKLTQLSSRSHPRHLVGKRTAQKDTIIDITSDSQVNSNFPYRWSPANLTFNNYFYLFLHLYIT